MMYRLSQLPQELIYRYAEYQFWDVDNDGENELLLGFYGGGPHGITAYETYEITDSGLVSKSMAFDEHSHVKIHNNQHF